MTYYEILEISEDASLEVVKAAYRALAKKYHPDSYRGNVKYAEAKMILINEAYQVLSDEQKRNAYDKTIRNNFSVHDNNSSNSYTSTAKDRENTEEKYHTNENNYNDNQQENYTRNNDTDNQHKDYTKNAYTNTEKQENFKISVIKRFFGNIGKGIISTLQENAKQVNNAYIDGMAMDEYKLVRRFKNSTGFRRIGYAKALETKGLLERNSEGRLVPTYKFKYYQ